MKDVIDKSCDSWKKHFMIKDHLGSVRSIVNEDGIETAWFDYKPYGSILHSGTNTDRQGYIGKEKDKETELANHGLRKYDSEIGRFTSIDPLWEKYYSWTPYQYSANNPVMFRKIN